MPEEQLSVQQFAGRLREKFPGSYDDLPDDVLVEHTIAHYPQYRDMLAPAPLVSRVVEGAKRLWNAQPVASDQPLPVTGFEATQTEPSPWVNPSEVIPPEAARQGTQDAIAAMPQPGQPLPMPAPAGATIGPVKFGVLGLLRRSVANTAVGHAVESALPNVADALNLHPSETVNSPTYAAHAEQLVAPDELIPAQAHGAPADVARGVLQGAGALTSGSGMATMVGAAATGGLLGPAVPIIGRLISLGFSVQTANDLVHQAPALVTAFKQGDDPAFYTQLGRMGFDAVMLRQMAKHAAANEPLGVVTPEQGAELLRQPMPRNTAMPAYLRKLVAQRQAEVAPGPGAKTAGESEVPGTPLQTLTDWLPNVTSPRQTPVERIRTITATAQHRLGATADAITNSMVKAESAILGLWDSYRRPPEYTDFKRAIGDWQGGVQYSAWEVGKFADEIKRVMPDKVRREGLTNWIQSGGDEALLRDRAARANPQLKPGYEASLNLNPTEKTLANNMRNYLDAQLEEAQRAGMLDHGVENYISQIWDKNTPMAQQMHAIAGASELQPKPFWTKERIFRSYFEGEDEGWVPKDKDVGYLLAAYHQSFAKAVADRGLIKQLLKAKASDGRPLVAVSGVGRTLSESEAGQGVRAHLVLPHEKTAPGDYVTIDSPALRRWKWVGADEAGKPIYLEGDMVVHPDAYRHLKNVLSDSALRKNPIGRAALRLSAEFKNTMLSVSAFHQTTVGVHALEHRVNPFTVPKLNLDNPVQRALVDHGLMVADFQAMEAFSEGVYGGGLINKIPVIGRWMHHYQSHLFRDYIPRLKMAMAQDALARNTQRYSRKLTRDQILELTSRQANAAFGELNYRMMGRNKTFQDALRLIFLAPDFLEARGKFVAQGLKPYGAEQRNALMLGAAVMYTGARIVNQLLNGDPEWDPRMAFSIRVGKRAFGMKSVQSEIAHLVTEPRSFAYSRLNPLTTKTAVEAVTGRDERGRPRDASSQLRDLAVGATPIPFQGLTRPGDYAPKEAALKAVGVSGRRYQTPAERTARDLVTKGVVFGESSRSPGEQKLMAKHRTSMEAGNFDANAVRQDLRAGRLTERDAKTLLKESTTPRLQRDFSRLSLEKALEVWAVANDSERKVLRPVLTNKAKQLDNRLPAERQALQQKLRQALSEKSAPQPAIPRAFRKLFGGPR